MFLSERVEEIDWYHSIDLGNGIVTPGAMTPYQQERTNNAIPQDLTNKSVLDIGAWDGHYSFLAEKRGASRILAIDSLFYKESSRKQTLDGFALAKEVLHSNVEYRIMPVEDLDKLHEQFDIVIFFGVYYHVKDPIDVFDKVCAKVRELLVVEGDALDLPYPMMMPNLADPDAYGSWRLTRPLLHMLLSKHNFSSMSELPFMPVSLFQPPGFDKAITTGRALLRCWR